ncbi:hypothetical protein STCU_04745 [Strigomonas culicis]|nr:hypothetical protein STCU_04745 [Strigomonas culicis]|eukprot:EPY29060.1 hypothetical protein STCU_04745 [Strigomonas culicis]
MYFSVLTILQQVGINMYHLNLLPYVCPGYDRANTNFLTVAASHFCSTTALVFAFAVAIGVRPVTFMVVFMTIYNVLDVLHRLPELRALIGAGGFDRVVYDQVLARLGVVAAQPANRDQPRALEAKLLQMHLFAASIEALLTLTVFLIGGSWFTLAFIQYGIARYNKDAFVQIAFTALRTNVENNVLSRSFVPQFVRNGFEKLCYYLGVVAQMG